jgi:mannose-6-phosphate isomerase-like protein (cupin superfamily)
MSAAARVVDSRAVSPRDDGTRPTLGTPTGFGSRLEQAVIDCGPGHSLSRSTGGTEEVLFVVGGEGRLRETGREHRETGREHRLEPESGAHLAPGVHYTLSNTGPEMLRLVAVQIPDPVGRGDLDAAAPAAAPVARSTDASHTADADAVRAQVRRLADQEAEAATTDREFRIVADPACGLSSATHFVGYIPTKRAPEHFHTYDEVIYVLDGEGVLHTDDGEHAVQAGSCIQLPACTVHCLENTGVDVMRVVAVFRPAGSPAAAYYLDGTPAFAGAPPVEAA